MWGTRLPEPDKSYKAPSGPKKGRGGISSRRRITRTQRLRRTHVWAALDLVDVEREEGVAGLLAVRGDDAVVAT